MRDVLVYPDLPQTTCPDEPAAPTADASDRGIVEYLEAVRLAGSDCRTRLAKIREAQAQWTKKPAAP